MDGEPVFGCNFQEDEENDEDCDGSKFPTSGYEYLKRVQLEARRCPQVVIADIDTSSFASKQTVKFDKKSGFTPAPDGYGASTEWQEQQAADFADVRQALIHYRTKVKASNLTAAGIPKKNDELSWCRFCLGQNMAANILERNASEFEIAKGENVQNGGMPPLLSVIVQMNQPTVLQVLEYHVDWMQKIGFSQLQGQWFYALLVCVEKPLLADVTSLLRTLARKCADLRATLDSPEHEFVAPLNLIIALVARYFEQFDLG